MIMTSHNDMQLNQNGINIADGTGVSCVCGFICLGTNYTLYLSSFIVGKLSITHSTKFHLQCCCVISPLRTVYFTPYLHLIV